ncbi:hypothetical protein MLD38_003584 [Melastoma candidum]|uniref:Uncharacterized protein n=1 Tax=Melastoma candidum TaxID=119954 RepID=A0ACB9S369_9MYRT|nr:hypothetical protein MLD38_003584 [Melastoma candidum]
MADSSPPEAAAAARDVEITIISAKHLKNVNWRNGPLVPYAAVYIAPNHRFSTRPDDSNSTRPVWNERFLLPHSSFSSPDSILSVDVFHSPPSDTSKPLVGSLRLPSSSLLPDSPSSPWILHSLDLLRPSGRPQGKLRVKLSLLPRQFDHPVPYPSPSQDYSFAPEGTYHYSPASPLYYPPTDYYPPPPPPASHAFARPPSQPLPRAPLSPVDYRVAHPPPPPPVRAYGGYHHDGNSNVDSVYRPSAPVDFTYPAKECEPSHFRPRDFRYAAASPLPRLSSSEFTYTGTPPHWISNRPVLWRNDQNSVSSERGQWVAPSAPAGTSVYGYRRGSEEVSVADAFGGLRLEEGNRAPRSDYGYSHGFGRED